MKFTRFAVAAVALVALGSAVTAYDHARHDATARAEVDQAGPGVSDPSLVDAVLSDLALEQDAEAQVNGAVNGEFTVFASASYTNGTYDSTRFYNYFHRGVRLRLVDTVTGSGTLACKVQGYDQLAATYYDIVGASVGGTISTTTTKVFSLYPGITASSNTQVLEILPTEWRVECVVTALTGSSFAMTVAGSLQL